MANRFAGDSVRFVHENEPPMTTLRAPVLLAALLSSLVAAPVARAASAECSNDFGSCSVDNDDGTFISCSCENGSGTGGQTDDDGWAGLDEEELAEVCEEELTTLCGPHSVPEGGVTCTTDLGSCTVNNEGFDSVSCSCEGGSGDGGTGGGNAWAGLSEEQLMEVCLEQVDSFCQFEGTGGEATSTGGDATTGADTGSLDGDDGTPITTAASGNEGNDGNSGNDSAGGTSGAAGEEGEVAGGDAGGGADDGDPEAGETGQAPAPTDDDVASSKCSVVPEGNTGLGWMLVGLGLLGLRRRRNACV